MILGIDISRVNQEKRTGVEWYAYHLLVQFTHILPRDVVVRLYTNAPLVDDVAACIPDHWEVRQLNWPPKRLWTQLRLSWEMFRHAPDVLFVPAHVFPWVHPKKTVMTVHDVAAVHFPESYNLFEQWYTTWSAIAAVKKLWKVIVPSEFTKKDIVTLSGIDRTDHIRVIAHGYDTAYADPVSRDVQQSYAITKPYLLSVGRLEYKKNTAQIIRAFDQVKKKHDVQLVLVGKPGHGYTDIAMALDASEYGDDIIIPGWVNEDDLRALYQQALVFVFPSLFEGFGIPVLEAFAAGVPVITSTSSSLPEVAGEAALFVEADDVDGLSKQMCRILEDDAVRDAFIAKGKKQVQQFSWEKTAKETVAVLLS